MPVIGHNCHELRIVDRQVTWRIVLSVQADAIVMLDVFAKKTGQTPDHVVSTCKRRLRAYNAND